MNQLKNILVIVPILALAACSNAPGDQQFFKGGDVSITSVGSDAFVNLSTDFNLGPNVSLAELSVKVMDPKYNTEKGTVSFSQLPRGVGRITVSVNVSLISTASASLGQTLPNGKPLPLALGVQAGDVLGVPILDHSIVYVGGDTNKIAFVGTALAIPGLDQVMNQLSTPANIFFMGNFSPKVMGVGGIYGSNNANENGIAVFGRYTAHPALQALDADEEQVDPNLDNDLNKIDSTTSEKLMNFMYGTEKHELHFD